MCEESVGDAGANHLGYYTCSFSPDGSGIAAHAFTGALHIWRREGALWEPLHALGGHFGPGAGLPAPAGGACLAMLVWLAGPPKPCALPPQWWMPAGLWMGPAC